MCSAVGSTDGGGVLIFFLISAKNIEAGESQGGNQCMVVLTTFHFVQRC